MHLEFHWIKIGAPKRCPACRVSCEWLWSVNFRKETERQKARQERSTEFWGFYCWRQSNDWPSPDTLLRCHCNDREQVLVPKLSLTVSKSGTKNSHEKNIPKSDVSCTFCTHLMHDACEAHATLCQLKRPKQTPCNWVVWGLEKLQNPRTRTIIRTTKNSLTIMTSPTQNLYHHMSWPIAAIWLVSQYLNFNASKS